MKGAWFWSLVRELRSLKACNSAKEKERDERVRGDLLMVSPWLTTLLPSTTGHSCRDGRLFLQGPCPPPTPGVHLNPCPLSQWCHPTMSSSVVPFSCPQSFPASGSFQMSQLFTSGGQSIGVSASTSVLPALKEKHRQVIKTVPDAPYRNRNF